MKALAASVALSVLSLLHVVPASAVPVYGTSAAGELNGSRDVDGNGLTGFNAWATGFTITWTIDFDTTTPGLWHYQYTFTGLSGSGQEKDVSHAVFDLTDDCLDPTDPLCVVGAMLDGSAIPANKVEIGNSDGITGSVKLDDGGGEGVTYTFSSNRMPVYGHLAVKGGGGPGTCPAPGGTIAACSNGLLAPMDTMNIIDYIARPNGAVPEPGTASLLGLGLAGLACAGRRRRA